jgi:hypothetical protein
MLVMMYNNVGMMNITLGMLMTFYLFSPLISTLPLAVELEKLRRQSI